MKIGMVADLGSSDMSEAGSIHTKTFKRAVAYIEEQLVAQSSKTAEIILANDKADAFVAKQAASELMERGVDIVLGHFSSAAAKSACQIYQGAQIPVLLPAATASDITHDFEFCFQICPDDQQQIQTIKRWVLGKGIKRICLKKDKTGQADAMVKQLKQELNSCHLSHKVLSSTELVIFIGRYHAAIDYLREHPFPIPVLLSDDCFHQELLKYEFSNLGEVYLCGLDDHRDKTSSAAVIQNYYKNYGDYPGTYYMETVAGAEIALACSATDNCIQQLKAHRWQTSLGAIEFQHQQNQSAQYHIWTIQQQQFKKLTERLI